MNLFHNFLHTYSHYFHNLYFRFVPLFVNSFFHIRCCYWCGREHENMTGTRLLRNLGITLIVSIGYCFQLTVTRISCQNCWQFCRNIFVAILAIALFNLFMASETGIIISHSAFPETSIFSKLRAKIL